MTDPIPQDAIDLYDRYTHEGMDRRLFFRRMTLLAGSAIVAESWIASISASPAMAAISAADDARLVTRKGALIDGNALKGYVAVRKGAKRPPVVIVIHENRGLTPHIEDVARRLALAGFMAIAPDMLTPMGGTPTNEDEARTAIGKLDLGQSVASVVDLARRLKADRKTSGKVGTVGFCWGGAFVNRLAVAGDGALAAGVSYYGPAPDPSEASKVDMPLMIHLASLDARVAQTAHPWIDALRKAGKPVTYHGYDGVNHAFNNDTSKERYDKAAADLAWGRTIAFFRRNLGK